MKRRHRHVKLRLLGILNAQIFGCYAARVQRLKAQITANTVIEVHHRLTNRKFGQVADYGAFVGGGAFIASPPGLKSALGRLRRNVLGKIDAFDSRDVLIEGWCSAENR